MKLIKNLITQSKYDAAQERNKTGENNIDFLNNMLSNLRYCGLFYEPL